MLVDTEMRLLVTQAPNTAKTSVHKLSPTFTPHFVLETSTQFHSLCSSEECRLITVRSCETTEKFIHGKMLILGKVFISVHGHSESLSTKKSNRNLCPLDHGKGYIAVYFF